MSGSCNNLKRADVSYIELAKKVNGVSERLDAIEDSIEGLKAPKVEHLMAEPPPPQHPKPIAAAPSEPMTFEVKAMPHHVPLPETLDMLMLQHQEPTTATVVPSPFEKK
jgi:hypothetical protein